MEIGSEFWLDSIPYENETTDEIPIWLSRYGNVVLTSSGRGALTLLLQQIKPRFKKALLPSYICESVVLPFIKQGYNCYFYDIREDLSPNIESIILHDDVGVFLHMGYYGFATNSNLADIISYYKSKSTIIIEDITHTLFSKYKRFDKNDYYIASIRKWLGLPSGGMLAFSDKSESIVACLAYNENFSNLRRQALLRNILEKAMIV